MQGNSRTGFSISLQVTISTPYAPSDVSSSVFQERGGGSIVFGQFLLCGVFPLPRETEKEATKVAKTSVLHLQFAGYAVF